MIRDKRKLPPPLPEVTFSEDLKPNEFAYCEALINNSLKYEMVVGMDKKLIRRKVSRSVAGNYTVKTIHIKILKKYERI